MSIDSDIVNILSDTEMIASDLTFKYHINDYQRTKFLVPDTDLTFDIHDDYALVSAIYVIKPVDRNDLCDIVLNGDKTLELETITCNGTYIPHFYETKTDSYDMIIDKKIVIKMLA